MKITFQFVLSFSLLFKEAINQNWVPFAPGLPRGPSLPDGPAFPGDPTPGTPGLPGIPGFPGNPSRPSRPVIKQNFELINYLLGINAHSIGPSFKGIFQKLNIFPFSTCLKWQIQSSELRLIFSHLSVPSLWAGANKPINKPILVLVNSTSFFQSKNKQIQETVSFDKSRLPFYATRPSKERPERIPTFWTIHVNHSTSSYVGKELLDPQFAGKKFRLVK